MGSSKKILLVANSTWNIANFRRNILRRLLELGHQVTVLAPIDAHISYLDEFPSVKHIHLRTLDRDGTNPLRDLFLILELIRKYRILSPDLILHYTHKPNIYGAVAARVLGISNVSVVTGLGYAFIQENWMSKLARSLYYLTRGCRDHILFENEDDYQYFLDQGLCGKDQADFVKGCGVDLRHFVPSPMPADDAVRFTFIGRLLHDKGIIEFVEAARIFKAEFPNTHFSVLGDFDPENPSSIDKDLLLGWIEEKVIEYHGFVKDVRPYIAASHCVVLPSYREGLPRIILEAMAMARPVITTDVPGCRTTTISGVNGTLVPARDIPALVTAFRDFVQMTPGQRFQQGLQGRSMTESYFDDRIIANELLQKIGIIGS